MTVADFMRVLLYTDKEEVVSAGPDAPIADLSRRMREARVGSVVITENGDPVGIVTDRDLALSALEEGVDASALVARDVMTPDPVTVDVDDRIFEAIDRMSKAGVRRMPVIENGQVAGVVTLDDFVRLLSRELEKLASVIEAESPS